MTTWREKISMGESNSQFEDDLDKDGQNFFFGKIKTALSIRAAQLGILLSLTVSLSFFLIPVLIALCQRTWLD